MKQFFTLIILLLSLSLAFSQEIKKRSNYIDVNIATDVPRIIWVNPGTDNLTLSSGVLQLNFGLLGRSEITDVTILVNNLPIGRINDYTEVDRSKHNYDKYINQRIVLEPGENTIAVGAKSANGKSTLETRTIIVNATEDVIAASTRKDYALFFAIDEYKEWGDLGNPINDARAINEELENFYGFESELIINPKQEDIILKLRQYTTKHYGEHDQLFIFFAGHGQFDDIFKQGYLVCADSKINDATKSSYLSHTVLREIIDNIPNQHIFLTIDACFGGTIDPLIAKSDSRGMDNMYSDIATMQFINRKLRFKTRRYLTSGGKEYVPDGRPGMNSPFTTKFLSALRSYGGADKIITIPELLLYLEKLKPEARTGSFGSNEPGSDFVFVNQN